MTEEKRIFLLRVIPKIEQMQASIKAIEAGMESMETICIKYLEELDRIGDILLELKKEWGKMDV